MNLQAAHILHTTDGSPLAFTLVYIEDFGMNLKFAQLLIFYLMQLIFIAVLVVLVGEPDPDHGVIKRTKFVRYPARKNMGECKPIYGNITVLIIHDTQRSYKVALRTLQCYVRSTNYKILRIISKTDVRVNKMCKNQDLLFKKHCAAAAYLNETDWMLVLDADTGVINPNHCIEEWIDPRVDIIFYERFYNWEIASGNYLVKNTQFAREFLMKWSDWGFHMPNSWSGYDNGAVQHLILQTVMPAARDEIKICETLWRMAMSYEMYMSFVTCVKVFLGATRIWPGKLRILKRAHAWVRDGGITDERWNDQDFMFHGWKKPEEKLKIFSRAPEPNFCGKSLDVWSWNRMLRIDENETIKEIRKLEKFYVSDFPMKARALPYLSHSDVGNCYPFCDDPVWRLKIV